MLMDVVTSKKASRTYFPSTILTQPHQQQPLLFLISTVLIRYWKHIVAGKTMMKCLCSVSTVAVLFLSWQQQHSTTWSFPIVPRFTTKQLTSTRPKNFFAVEPGFSSSSALFMVKSRKQKQNRKQTYEKRRPEEFYDAVNEAGGKKKKKKKKKGKRDEEEELREATMTEAQSRMEERPEVSTMIVDEETGIEVVAQGKSIMDVVTRKSVQLSNMGPEYRLAQMFPGVPMEVREKYRFDWKTVEVPEIVDSLRESCSVKLEDGSRGIPPHPSIANKAIDFILANRDLLGSRMKKTLGRVTMRSMSQGNKQEAIENQKLWKNFLTLENHISAPFRQILFDAEGRVGPQFGNLDVKSYCSGELYERAANYLVLKGMVATWEKKVVDADYQEKTPQTKENYMTVLAHGDPRRFLPDPPILFTMKECAQVCAMSQKLVKAFVEEPELFNDLPVEIRFLEKALTIKGGKALRQFIAEEFCPAEGITPEGLREGMRRLAVQMDNMQTDPYGDLTNILEQLCDGMQVGTDDDRDPYAPYLANKDPNGPGGFQTYTFNHGKLSLVRFLDGQYDREGGGGEVAKEPSPSLANLFNFGGAPKEQPVVKEEPEEDEDAEGWVYKVPAARAAGRPHELGWLNMLDDQKGGDQMRLGNVKPGRIIQDDE